MSSNIIFNNAKLARQAGFEVRIDEMQPSLRIESNSASYSFEYLDADDMLDEAQRLADTYPEVTQTDVLLHFALCWSQNMAA